MDRTRPLRPAEIDDWISTFRGDREWDTTQERLLRKILVAMAATKTAYILTDVYGVLTDAASRDDILTPAAEILTDAGDDTIEPLARRVQAHVETY